MKFNPSSTFTFFFTDIEGSTRLWERQPEAMRAALARHNEILSRAIEGNGGRVFRTVGDAFCASFATAPGALVAAVQAQRDLAAEPWGELEYPIRVRIALHTGEAEETADDYIGACLNHVARLLGVCHGGQTLLTLVTKELLGSSLPEGARLLDLGEHRLRDLTHPARVFQLAVNGLPDSFPPLKSLSFYPNNLPVLLTNFIGRDRDLAEICELLSKARLVTLTGPGGTGKTRLALQAAAEVLEEYPDGAWVIELAPISNPAMIVQNIAMALNIREQPGRPLQTVLVEALSAKKLFLVLDNCEHLTQACADLSLDLLRACAGLKILTSSRETLGVPGEVMYRVPSLSLPDAPQPSFEEYAQSEAVRLFVERASAIRTQFKLTPENAPLIAQICRRLDGIPLAIELAAARSNLFTPAQIASRLDDRFRLLTGGSRTALPRQQTLEALFDWSHELLSTGEKVFFRRLSVFAGGWTFEAAEALYSDAGAPVGAEGAPVGDEGGGKDVMELLSQLVNKSLVVVDERGQEARYRMLETIRQYAQKKLLEAGEAFEIRTRHMRYFANFSRDTWESIRQRGTAWLSQNVAITKAEVDNLRSAQEWALDNDLPAALLFAGSLFFIWESNGLADEMRRAVEEALRRAAGAPEFQGELTRDQRRLLAGAWTGYADLLLILGQNEDSLLASQKATEQAHLAEDLPTLAYALSIQGVSAGLTNREILSLTASEESVAVARKSGEKWLLGMSLITTAGDALFSKSYFDRAQMYMEEGVRIFQSLKDPYWLAMAKTFEGMFDLRRNDLEAAREHFTNSFATLKNSNDVFVMNMARSGLADVSRLQGDYEQAIPLYLNTVKTWRELGNLGAAARCLECLGFIAIARAKSASSEDRMPQLKRAATLLGAAEAIRKERRAAMNPTEQVEYDREKGELDTLAAGSESTGALIRDAWAAGAAMGVEVV